MERWEPLKDMVSLRDAMNSLFQESFVRPGGVLSPSAVPMPMDVLENENEFVVKASLPGIKPENVQITVQGDTITIRGETQGEEEKKGETWHVRERRHGTSQRTLTLAAPINADKATAKFEHGILTLTLPKAEEAKPKQIKVTSA
jgi:HSP20 family protein